MFSELNGKKKYTNLDFFDNIDNQEKAYWLGFIWGDGWVTVSTIGNYRFGLNITDEKHLLKIAAVFNTPVRLIIKKGKNQWKMEVCNKKFVKVLINRGIIPKKSTIGVFTTIDYVPLDLQRHFIRGLLDADGCLYVSKLGALFLVFGGNEVCITRIRSVICTCLDVPNNSIFRRGEHYCQMVWSGKNATKISNWIYQDASVLLERKHEIFMGWID